MRVVASMKFPGIRSTLQRSGRRAEIGTYKKVKEGGTKVEGMIIESSTVCSVAWVVFFAHNTICVACLAVICIADNDIC